MFCRHCRRNTLEKDSRTVLRRVGKEWECFPNCGKRPSSVTLTNLAIRNNLNTEDQKRFSKKFTNA